MFGNGAIRRTLRISQGCWNRTSRVSFVSFGAARSSFRSGCGRRIASGIPPTTVTTSLVFVFPGLVSVSSLSVFPFAVFSFSLLSFPLFFFARQCARFFFVKNKACGTHPVLPNMAAAPTRISKVTVRPMSAIPTSADDRTSIRKQVHKNFDRSSFDRSSMSGLECHRWLLSERGSAG